MCQVKEPIRKSKSSKEAMHDNVQGMFRATDRVVGNGTSGIFKMQFGWTGEVIFRYGTMQKLACQNQGFNMGESR